MRKRRASHWMVLVLASFVAMAGCQTGMPQRTSGTKIRPASGPATTATAEAFEEARARELRKTRAQRALWANKTFEEFERAVYKEPFPGGKYIVR